MIMKQKKNHTPDLLLKKVVFPIFLFFTPYIALSQCTVTISNFPYQEDFEGSAGNWEAGGTSSDWKWGTPSKPVINAAGSGSKCWITGEVNRTGYNGGQNAWLKSPCFNFTNLRNPYLKFKVFWETEAIFDGANLQYSTDNGVTWQVIGKKNEPSTCLTEKWYNDGPLVSMGSQDAWSGNMQTSRPPCYVSGGSAGWGRASVRSTARSAWKTCPSTLPTPDFR
jgi:bacillopeptidase F (M6 metalloprotease family)